MKRFLIFIPAIFASAFAFSAIQIKCISVAANGNATINWSNTASAATFHAYYIFHSTTSSGPFVIEDSVLSFATQIFTDVSANANSVKAYYFVVLKSTSGPDIMSDTAQAIQLSVINTGNGYATLSWNATQSPLIPTNSSYHKIYRKFTSGGWTLVDSINISTFAMPYKNEITICSDTVKYRVEVSDNSGCVSVSNVDGKYFRDVLPPNVPAIDSVSMNALGNANIGWKKNISGDTKAYVVLQLVGSSWIPFDTLYGINNTFLQTGINATSASQQFRVLAIDSCLNPSAMSVEQKTILLTGTLNKCAATFQLSWNSYINSPSSPVYTILVSENGGAERYIGATGNTSFNATGLKADSTYCFRVRAILNGSSATSTSNQICVTVQLPAAPLFNYISKVTVAGTDAVVVQAFVDTAADITRYNLTRSTSPTGSFSYLQSVPFSGNPIVTFFDYPTTDKIYYYRVASVDSCGNDALPSQISNTIFLSVVANENGVNDLSWNDYAEWSGQVSSYYIYRKIDDIPDAAPLAIITASQNFYQDDVSMLYNTGGNICYTIVAREGNGDVYGFSESSFSNEVCVKETSLVFIPNAFHPGTINGVFNPVESFIPVQDYHFKIYNRWGELLFETSNPNTGWDGLYFGHRAAEGIYVYHLIAKKGDGTEIRKIGMVTLIRD